VCGAKVFEADGGWIPHGEEYESSVGLQSRDWNGEEENHRAWVNNADEEIYRS
jgi:hypothetical protein